MELIFERVTKFYGSVIGVNDVSCRVGPGITGFLGANGAGKSTLIKLASGQLRPSLGRVTVGDRSAWSTAAKRSIGYSPDLNSFYDEMTGRRFVQAMSRLYGYTRREATQRAERALADVGMSDRADKVLAAASHGMRQRIKLAQALVHDPPILLLDEPLSGIDPGGRREINELLGRLARQGKTILVSSHILVEVEQVADRVLMMSRGRIIASGTLAEVRGLLADRPFTVELECDDARRLGSLLLGLEDVNSVEIQGAIVRARTRNHARFFAMLADLLHAHQLAPRRVETMDTGADAVFEYLESGSP